MSAFLFAVSVLHTAPVDNIAVWMIFGAVVASLTTGLRDAITLSQACHLFSPVPSIHAMNRWVHKGTRGVRLQTWLRGGRRVTTPAAVEEFLRAINEADELSAASVPATDTTKQGRSEKAALMAALG